LSVAEGRSLGGGLSSSAVVYARIARRRNTETTREDRRRNNRGGWQKVSRPLVCNWASAARPRSTLTMWLIIQSRRRFDQHSLVRGTADVIKSEKEKMVRRKMEEKEGKAKGVKRGCGCFDGGEKEMLEMGGLGNGDTL